MLGFAAVFGWWWWGPLCFLAGSVAVQVALRAKIQAERGEINVASGGVVQMGLVCGFLGAAMGVLALLVVMWWLTFG